jgi:HEAT repeat protein
MRLREASRRGDVASLRAALVDPDMGWAAAGFLADNDCADAAADIARLLDASDEAARRAAIRALGRLGAVQCLDRIWELAHSEPSRKNRERAVVALGQLGGSRERDYLVELLDDGDFAIRSAAVWGLGQLGDPSALEPVERARRSERRRNPMKYVVLARGAYRTTIQSLRSSQQGSP